MSKKIQINVELYDAIYNYFLGDGADVNYIKKGLQERQNALIKRALYSLSKKESLTDEQRKFFEKEYRSSKG